VLAAIASKSGEPTATKEGILSVHIVLRRRVLSSFSAMLRPVSFSDAGAGVDADAGVDTGPALGVGLVRDSMDIVMVLTVFRCRYS